MAATSQMPWYHGPTLLEHLEAVDITDRTDWTRRRFPVQWIIRQGNEVGGNCRAAAGRIEGGVWRIGDEVVALPSGGRSRVCSIDTYDGPLEVAYPGLSVAVRLEDDLDVGRGEMLVGPENLPRVDTELSATVCWMAQPPLRAGARYMLKHATRTTRALVENVDRSSELNEPSDTHRVLGLNEVGTVSFRLLSPLVVNSYRENRTTGSFILINEASNMTVGAAMVV